MTADTMPALSVLGTAVLTGGGNLDLFIDHCHLETGPAIAVHIHDDALTLAVQLLADCEVPA